MKILKFNILILTLVLLGFGLSGCEKAADNFIHTDNLISAMVCENARTNDAKSIVGKIYEYSKDGVLLDDGFTAEDATGGSGVIVFRVPAEDRKAFDLTSVYLRATLTWDEFVTPSLSGLHNILVTDENPEGMVIAVTSGIGTVRKYRIMGIYE